MMETKSNNTFSFNKVYYLNADLDNSTHRDLFQSIENCSIMYTNSSIATEYFLIKSKGDLTFALKKIKEDTLNGTYPLIHISSHGGPEGLLLPSKGRLHWNELSYYLQEINLRCRNNLFVVFACCEGAYIALPMIDSMLVNKVKPRAPVFGYIAPVTEIKFEQIEMGYLAFYRELLRSFSTKTFTLDNGIEGLNRVAEGIIQCYSCVQLFRDVVDSALKNDFKKYENNLALDTRIFKLLDDQFQKTGVLPNPQNYTKLRSVLLQEEFYIQFFNNLRLNYFMIDLYPKNDSRFIKLSSISNWDEITKNVR